MLALGRPGGWRRGALHVDFWARTALGALGLGIRVGAFLLVRGRWPDVHPMVAVLTGELLAQIGQALVTLTLSLPTAERFAEQPPWRLEIDDERVDALYAWMLFVPLLVILIYYGYSEHGLLGAAGWSIGSLGPHYLLKLSNDRRASLVRHAAALRTVNAALEGKQRELADFVYTVTHDLKSPVNAMLLTADEALERDDGDLSPESRADLEQIVRLAGTTEHMISDILGLFRITTSDEPVQDVALDTVVTRAVGRLQAQVSAKRAQVEVGPLPVVRGRATKLEHAIANLLANAVKYVPWGAGHVQVTAERRNGAVVVCVRDNGIGVEPRYHQTIFDLFTRVPAAGQVVDGAEVEGTGVGLAIVKRVVEEHGGAVWVESAAGQGSAFFVRLPARDAVVPS